MDLADSQHQPTEEAFRAEALRWLPNVSRYARLLTRNQSDADDLAQETFLRAYMNWTTFRPGSDCRKWLFTICRNFYLRDQQRGSRIVGVDDPEVDVVGVSALYWQAAERGIENLFDRIDLAPALERGLRDMLPEYREVVLLIDIEDYTYADAAMALDVPVGTVRSRLFRARRLLQEALWSMRVTLVWEGRSSRRLRKATMEDQRMTTHTVSHIPCEEVIRAVWDYLDEEIDDGRRERIRKHLELCAHCRDQYTFEGAFLRSVGRLLEDDRGTESLRASIENALIKHGFGKAP